MSFAESIWSACSSLDCARLSVDDWDRSSMCRDSYKEVSTCSSSAASSPMSRDSRRRSPGAREQLLRRLELLTQELFQLHDLNSNGLLEESELVRLNEKIALLHHGQDADTAEVRSKYSELFRGKLDPLGRPVAYEKFRGYAREVLDALDVDPEAQEMILEQFVEEAFSLPDELFMVDHDAGCSADASPRDMRPTARGWRCDRQVSMDCCWG